MNDQTKNQLTTVAEYSPTAAALIELRNRFSGVLYPVETTKGMQDAIAARAEVRGYRIKLEKTRADIKAPALERCRQIDAEAKRLTADLESLEGPIDEQIKAEQQRKEREKEAAAEAERQRVAAINARFAEITAMPGLAIGKTAHEVRALIVTAEAIDPESFPDDMRPAAVFEKRKAVAGLQTALDARIAQDERDAKAECERRELEELRAERSERDAREAAERKHREAEAEKARKAEQAKQEAAQREADRKAAEARAEAERVAAAQRKAEADKLAADRAELAREKAEADRLAKIESDRQAAEAKRLADERAELKRQQDAAAQSERDRQAKIAADAREAEKKAAAEREQREISATSTMQALTAGHAFLVDEGYGSHKVTKMLAAAIKRESSARKAA